MSARRVASASSYKPNDPKASTEGGIHEPRVPGSRAPGLAALKAFRVAGFGALRVDGLGALQVAGLRVESVVGLIGIRTLVGMARKPVTRPRGGIRTLDAKRGTANDPAYVLGVAARFQFRNVSGPSSPSVASTTASPRH